MKRTILSKFLFPILSIAFIYLTSCSGHEADGLGGQSYFYFSNNAQSFGGFAVKNTTLKAIEVPCQNNNTIRMYFSDSAATLGMPASLKVVGISRAGRLLYHECYFEISTSAIDTYISTGTDNMFVTVKGKEGENGGQSFDFPEVLCQHYTSSPQSDFVKVYGSLKIK